MKVFSPKYLRGNLLSLFIFTSIIVIDSGPCFSQGNNNTFSYFRVNAQVTEISNSNLLNRYWQPGKGIQIYLQAPFFTGDIQLGVNSIPFKGRENIYPDFKGTLMFLAFGKEMKLPFNFYLYSGIKTGYFMMGFKGDTIDIYQQTESEFLAGVDFTLAYMVFNNMFITAAADLSILFTKHHLKFYYLSAGASYRFQSPAWLRNFFN